MTLDRLQRDTRMGMAIGKVIDAEITSKITIVNLEIDAFYQGKTEDRDPHLRRAPRPAVTR